MVGDIAYLIEESTGNKIISFLNKNRHLQVFFAPGPRFSIIDKETNNLIIITDGAGDSHIGAFMASWKLGYFYIKSLAVANEVSAKVVEMKGILMPSDAFKQIIIN